VGVGCEVRYHITLRYTQTSSSMISSSFRAWKSKNKTDTNAKSRSYLCMGFLREKIRIGYARDDSCPPNRLAQESLLELDPDLSHNPVRCCSLKSSHGSARTSASPRGLGGDSWLRSAGDLSNLAVEALRHPGP